MYLPIVIGILPVDGGTQHTPQGNVSRHHSAFYWEIPEGIWHSESFPNVSPYQTTDWNLCKAIEIR